MQEVMHTNCTKAHCDHSTRSRFFTERI